MFPDSRERGDKLIHRAIPLFTLEKGIFPRTVANRRYLRIASYKRLASWGPGLSNPVASDVCSPGITQLSPFRCGESQAPNLTGFLSVLEVVDLEGPCTLKNGQDVGM